MTLSIKRLLVTFSIATCILTAVILLNEAVVSVVMLSIVMLIVNRLNFVMPSVVMLNVIVPRSLCKLLLF
jgi:hypothetical protein